MKISILGGLHQNVWKLCCMAPHDITIENFTTHLSKGIFVNGAVF